MNEKYRLMTYFTIATLHLYRKDVVAADSVEDFRKKNPELVQRIFDEATNLFNFELSWNQVDTAIGCYLAESQSIRTSHAAAIASRQHGFREGS